MDPKRKKLGLLKQHIHINLQCKEDCRWAEHNHQSQKPEKTNTHTQIQQLKIQDHKKKVLVFY